MICLSTDIVPLKRGGFPKAVYKILFPTTLAPRGKPRLGSMQEEEEERAKAGHDVPLRCQDLQPRLGPCLPMQRLALIGAPQLLVPVALEAHHGLRHLAPRKQLVPFLPPPPPVRKVEAAG